MGSSFNQSQVGMASLASTVASAQNSDFSDIKGLSTVLSSGKSWAGIQVLANAGAEIDGVSVKSMVNGWQGQSIEGLADAIERGQQIDFENGKIIVYTETPAQLEAKQTTRYENAYNSNLAANDSLLDTDPSKLSGDDRLIAARAAGDAAKNATVGTKSFEIDPSALTQFSLTLNTGESITGTTNLKDIGSKLEVKLENSESIMQNPGTMFLIQQFMEQLKSHLSAVGATGKVGGDVLKEANTSFTRALG